MNLGMSIMGVVITGMFACFFHELEGIKYAIMYLGFCYLMVEGRKITW
jgi:hypothetical protein